jgi:ribosome-binding protein aMBF1 (putative translation factor)
METHNQMHRTELVASSNTRLARSHQVLTQSRRTVDRYVGLQIQLQRALLGLSREQLAQLIGESASEVERYERGYQRPSPGCLFGIAEALHTSLSSFFAGIRNPLL